MSEQNTYIASQKRVTLDEWRKRLEKVPVKLRPQIASMIGWDYGFVSRLQDYITLYNPRSTPAVATLRKWLIVMGYTPKEARRRVQKKSLKTYVFTGRESQWVPPRGRPQLHEYVWSGPGDVYGYPSGGLQ